MARIQFTVGQLLLLTTVAAIFLAVVISLDLPAAMRPAIIVGYGAYLVAWLAIRGPAVLGGWNELRERRARLREERRQLAREIEARRSAQRGRAPYPRDDDAPRPDGR
jgi:hypothetical protein